MRDKKGKFDNFRSDSTRVDRIEQKSTQNRYGTNKTK